MPFKRFLFLPLLTLLFLFTTQGSYAQGPGDFVLGETSVVVPANGSTTLSFEVFCLDFGKKFPSELGTPDGRAEQGVLQVVRMAIENDTADSDPLALQMAIWSLREDTPVGELFPDTDLPAEAKADALLADSEDATVSPLRTDRGIALDKAVADGTIQVSSSDFRFVETDKPRPDDEPYHGAGTLTLSNTTDQPVEVYFPFGTVFAAANDDEQDMIAYAIELEQLATATVVPTSTPAATATAAATATVAPASTPAPTPATVPQTGAESAPESGTAPWMLIITGMILLGMAGFLISRYQYQD